MLLGGDDVTVVDFGEEVCAVAFREGVGVDVADERFELFEGAVGGVFGGLPYIDSLLDFAEAEEAFGAEAEGGAEGGVGFRIDSIGVGPRCVFAGAVLFHRPFELGVGFVGQRFGGTFVKRIGRFGVYLEEDVGEEEVLRGGARGFGEGGEEFGVGFVETALDDKAACFREGGGEVVIFGFDVGGEIGECGGIGEEESGGQKQDAVDAQGDPVDEFEVIVTARISPASEFHKLLCLKRCRQCARCRCVGRLGFVL